MSVNEGKLYYLSLQFQTFLLLNTHKHVKKQNKRKQNRKQKKNHTQELLLYLSDFHAKHLPYCHFSLKFKLFKLMSVLTIII